MGYRETAVFKNVLIFTLIMKKSFFVCLCLVLLSFFCVELFAGNPQNNKYRIVHVELPWGQTTLFSTFYCFNELDDGRILARELYGIENLDKILKAGRFKKLMTLPVGSELSAWNYAIMTHNKEFWFFENRDDGYLWGTGRF